MSKTRFERFCDVRDELELKGERFSNESLKRIAYNNLILAFIGNAGKTSHPNWDSLDMEYKRRINSVSQHSIEELYNDKDRWEILDDMGMLYDVMRVKVTKNYVEENAPKWRLLVYYMQKLRGNWSGGRDSYYLKMIYTLIPQAIEENIVPIGWLNAVKHNADTFDGEYNDGRIMRDGDRGGLSGNIAGYLGFFPIKQEDGCCGGYEELFEKILNPQQMIQYVTPIEGLEDD